MKPRNQITRPHEAPYTTRDTALASAWLVFGHALDSHLPVVIYSERGQDSYLQFRIHNKGPDLSPLQVMAAWDSAPEGINHFQSALATLLKGGPVAGGDVILAQWPAYACFMRLVFQKYKTLKNNGEVPLAYHPLLCRPDFEATTTKELTIRRMHAVELVLRDLAPDEMARVDFSTRLRWWDKPEGQMQFERWLHDAAHNSPAGKEAEIWAMRLPAYVVAAREFFNHMDQLRVYVQAARDHQQYLVRESSNGKAMEVSPFADPHRVRDLKREGGM